MQENWKDSTKSFGISVSSNVVIIITMVHLSILRPTSVHYCWLMISPFFKLMSLFVSQNSTQDTTLHVVVMSSLICGSFSAFPCFSWPWQFWRVLVKYFVKQFDSSDIFMTRLGLWDFEEVKYLFFCFCQGVLISTGHHWPCSTWSLGEGGVCQVFPLWRYFAFFIVLGSKWLSTVHTQGERGIKCVLNIYI